MLFCALCSADVDSPNTYFTLARQDDLVDAEDLPRSGASPFVCLSTPYHQITLAREDTSQPGNNPLKPHDRKAARGRLHRIPDLPVDRKDVELYSDSTNSGLPAFPLCSDCFSMSYEFLSFRYALTNHTEPRFRMRSLDDLHYGLSLQWLKDKEAQTDRLAWPHGSYRSPDVVWYTWSPWKPIPSLPKYIKSHLEPLSLKTDEILSIGADMTVPGIVLDNMAPSRLVQMPVELIQEIALYLDANSVFALRLSCRALATSVLLDQNFWYIHFIRGEILGFFFNFDAMNEIEELRAKVIKSRMLPPRCDWKALVGTLARFSSFDEDRTLCDAPNAFKNRRRIWKILEMVEHYVAETSEQNGLSIAIEERSVSYNLYRCIVDVAKCFRV